MLSTRYLTRTFLSASLIILPAATPSSMATQLPKLLLAQAQSQTPEKIIDQAFRANSFPPGTSVQLRRLLTSIKTWMGPYKSVRKEGNMYFATFEKGSLPLSIRMGSMGKFSVSFSCPRSTSLSLNQASSELQQLLSSCPGLQN